MFISDKGEVWGERSEPPPKYGEADDGAPVLALEGDATEIECLFVRRRLEPPLPPLGDGEPIPACAPDAVFEDDTLDEEVDAVSVEVRDENKLEAVPPVWE